MAFWSSVMAQIMGKNTGMWRIAGLALGENKAIFVFCAVVRRMTRGFAELRCNRVLLAFNWVNYLVIFSFLYNFIIGILYKISMSYNFEDSQKELLVMIKKKIAVKEKYKDEQ